MKDEKLSAVNRDIFGNVLEVGDEIAFSSHYRSELLTGKIVKFTLKRIKVLVRDVQYGEMEYATEGKRAAKNFGPSKAHNYRTANYDPCGDDSWKGDC